MFALSLNFRQVGVPRPRLGVAPNICDPIHMHDTASKPATQPSGQRRSLALRFISGKYQGGEFPMNPNKEIVVGRSSDLDMVLVEEMVSRKHARIAYENEAVVIEDLGSTNGTFVNESRIHTQQLADADQVRFGDAIYKFLAGSNIESAYHEAIHNMAIQDGMTGIHNKRFFMEFLERELAVASRYGHPLTLVMFDVDHFKKVNDTHGHLAGDAVLKDLAGRIRPRIRREDLFARYGGEEFVCVLPSTALPGGIVFADHLRQLIEERPTEFDNAQISFTISLGVTTLHHESGVDVTALIKRADDNLYAAKRGGRNRVVPTLADLIPG